MDTLYPSTAVTNFESFWATHFSPDQPPPPLLYPSAAHTSETSGAKPSLVRPEGREASGTQSMPPALEANWHEINAAQFSVSFRARLARLAGLPDGWNAGSGKKLSVASLSLFLSFWTKMPARADEPETTLVPNGHLQAEWYKSTKQFLKIEFCDEEFLIYGLINGKRVHEGRATVKELLGLLSESANVVSR
jgi:hypothetical protein